MSSTSKFLVTYGDTTTIFSSPQELYGWGCGVSLIEGRIPHTKTKETLYLCSDIAAESEVSLETKEAILKTIRMQVLTKIITEPDIHDRKEEKDHIVKPLPFFVYFTVLRKSIDSIRLYICNCKGEIISLEGNQMNCSLLFIPPRKNKNIR